MRLLTVILSEALSWCESSPIGRKERCEQACLQDLQRHSGFTEEALRPVALSLAALARKAPNSSLISVFKKYNQSRFQEVAKVNNLEQLLTDRMMA